MSVYALHFPPDYRAHLRPLLHQQMWLFGRDILSPHGNLLYDYRFTHQRAPAGGGSMYTYQEAGRQIALWGWGIWFGREEWGGIFVNRYRARPVYTPAHVLPGPIHHEERLPPMASTLDSVFDVEKMRSLWQDLLTWLAAYETWVLESCGRRWRLSVLQRFTHRVTAAGAVDQLPDQWRLLAGRSQALPIKKVKIKRGREE